jgi:hypothetical protein
MVKMKHVVRVRAGRHTQRNVSVTRLGPARRPRLARRLKGSNPVGQCQRVAADRQRAQAPIFQSDIATVGAPPENIPRQLQFFREVLPSNVKFVVSKDRGLGVMFPEKGMRAHSIVPNAWTVIRPNAPPNWLVVISNDVVHSGLLGKNGRYHTFHSVREGAPSEASS